MAEDGRLVRIASRSAAEPSLSDLLDPVALEERLQEARARRAEALARRPETAPPAFPGQPAPAATPAVPHQPAPAMPTVPSHPSPAAMPATPRRAAAAVSILIFLAGLGLGGAVVAVLALRALPTRMAATTDFVPAAVEAPAAAPIVAAAPPPVAAAPPDAAPALAAPETPPPAASLPPRDLAGLAAPASEAAPPPVSALPGLATALPAEPPAATPATATPAATPPSATPPSATPLSTPPSLPARVFIHYPSSAAAAAATARDTLRAAGLAEVEIVPVRYAIGRSNIRYYHDADRDPAAALAPLVAPALGGDAPEARDFTDYATPAAPGNVEIWLAGTPSGGARTAAVPSPRRTAPSTPRSAPDDTPFQMPGVIAPAPTRAEQVERILIERLRQGR